MAVTSTLLPNPWVPLTEVGQDIFSLLQSMKTCNFPKTIGQIVNKILRGLRVKINSQEDIHETLLKVFAHFTAKPTVTWNSSTMCGLCKSPTRAIVAEDFMLMLKPGSKCISLQDLIDQNTSTATTAPGWKCGLHQCISGEKNLCTGLCGGTVCGANGDATISARLVMQPPPPVLLVNIFRNQGADLEHVAPGADYVRYESTITCTEKVTVNGFNYKMEHLIVHELPKKQKKSSSTKAAPREMLHARGHFVGYVPAANGLWMEHNDNKQTSVRWDYVKEKAQRITAAVLVLTDESQRADGGKSKTKVFANGNLFSKIISFILFDLPLWNSLTTISKSWYWFRLFPMWNLRIEISGQSRQYILENLAIKSVPVNTLSLIGCEVNKSVLDHILGLGLHHLKLIDCPIGDFNEGLLFEFLSKVHSLTASFPEVGVGRCCLSLCRLLYVFLCSVLNS